MRSRKTGQIDEGLWLFGTPESCVYLLEGANACALISAGLSYILPDLFRQMKASGISEKKIDSIFILHAHFDHVGVVPYLKRQWPHVKIYASARAWDVLGKPKALGVIHDYTRKVCQRVKGGIDVLNGLDWQWRDDIRGETLREKERIDLGDRQIEIYETPGHSSCSISAYVPQLKALFPSDAAAIPYGDEYVIAAGSSFDDYFRSLDKLAGLDVELLGADHYGYITQEEASAYIDKSKAAATLMRERLQTALSQEKTPEKAARKLVTLHFSQRPDYFIHPDILLHTYTQMLKQFVSTT